MKTIYVCITHFERPEMLMRLVKQLDREGRRAGVSLRVFVVDDASKGFAKLYESLQIYQSVHFRIESIRLSEHQDKKGFWRLVNHLLAMVRRDAVPSDFVYFLQDDVEIAKDFFGKSTNAFGTLEENDPDTATLVLFKPDTGYRERWTQIAPRLDSDRGVYYLGWVDMLFMCRAKFVNEFIQTVYRISPTRWDADPLLSSGVGQQISLRAARAGFSMYGVADTLLYHGGHASRLNPLERDRTTLTAKKP
jgi:hypothetical protein